MPITVNTRLRKLFFVALVVGLLVFGPSMRTQAQVTTAGITGVVADPSGAIVAGVAVTATGESTGFTRSFVTGTDGRFRLLELPLGTYTLTAEKTGFKKYQRTGFGPILAGDVAHLDIVMQVGTALETVDVTGTAPMLQTESGVVRTPINQDQIDNLPLNSRSPVALLLQQPGAQVSLQAQGDCCMGFNFNGQNQMGNYFTLDGTDASIVSDPTLTMNGGNLVTTSVDSIAEFDTGSQNYSADVKGSGGYVNIITKSGSNKFHGDGYEFLRNDVLDASNYFATSPDKLRLNDFGGTITGPIRRNKTFFMGSWEGQRIRRPTTLVLVVPTEAFRATVDPRFKEPLDLTPLPTEPIAGDPNIGTFISAPSNAVRQDLATGRVDQVFSEKDSFFGRYTINSLKSNNASPFVGFTSSNDVRHQYLTLSETHLFSPTLLNSLKVGIDRFDEKGRDGRPNATVLLDAFTLPDMSIAGGEDSIEFAHTGASIVDDLTWTRGKHSLKFGGIYWGTIMGRGQASSIGWHFQTDQAFALDQPDSVFSYFGTGEKLPGNHYSDTQQGLYVQDDFHATRNLTINMGLRYDNYGLQKESRNRIENVVDDPLGPFRAPGEPLYRRNNLDFAPRLGFSWLPFGQKRLVVRGGYGLFWGGRGSLESTVNYQLNTVNPFNLTSADDPNLAYPLDLSAAGEVNSTPGRYVSDPNASDLYTQQWNLTTEYQASDSTTLRAAYVGNHGVHIPGETNPNGFNALTGQRPDLALGEVYEQIDEDSTVYHGLELSFRRRFSHGLGLDAHYTWSHDIGIESSVNEVSASIGLGSGQIQSFRQRGLSRGNLAFDVRHQLAMDYHYEFPHANLSNGLMRTVVNGWGLAGIVTLTSGTPFNLVTGGDIGSQRFNQFPNIVPGVNPYINGVSPAAGMLNLAAFAVPTVVDSFGEIVGDLANNVLRTHPFFTIDSALTKTIKIKEGLNLQFRAEFFNLLNHPNFLAPFNNMSVPSLFGKSLSVRAPREGQLGLKLIF